MAVGSVIVWLRSRLAADPTFSNHSHRLRLPPTPWRHRGGDAASSSHGVARPTGGLLPAALLFFLNEQEGLAPLLKFISKKRRQEFTTREQYKAEGGSSRYNKGVQHIRRNNPDLYISQAFMLSKPRCLSLLGAGLRVDLDLAVTPTQEYLAN